MADGQETEQRPYKLTTSSGEERPGSRGYTGNAKAEYPNGDVYEGGFVNGVKEGKGKYTWANGDSYEGTYKKDKKDGIGKMVFTNNGHYFGNLFHLI